MKTVLITGSEGFIGSYVCDELLASGYLVVGIDSYTKYGKVFRKHIEHENFRFFQKDLIKDHDEIYETLKQFKIDYIIHTAALIGGISLFHEYPFDIIDVNSLIDSSVLKLAIKIQPEKFVALSSSMVYESAIVMPTEESCIEKIPPPLSTYGFSKLALEYKCKGAFKQYGLKYTIVRPFNAVGIGEEDFLKGQKSHVLPDLIVKAISNKEELPILGNGSQIRCYTHARDIARGVRLAMESEASTNEAFNISTQTATSVNVLAQKIWRTVNGNLPLRIKNETPYEYDVQVRVPDVSKAKRILGFEALTELKIGIKETYEHIKERLKNV